MYSSPQALLVHHRYIVVASQYVNFPNRFLIERSLRSTARSHNFAESETREEAREFAGCQSKSFPTGFETFIRQFRDLSNLNTSCFRVHVDELKERSYYRLLGR